MRETAACRPSFRRLSLRRAFRRPERPVSLLPPAAILVAALAFLGPGACPRLAAAGSAEAERRSVRDFERVVLEGSGELEVSQGPAESLLLSADPSLLRRIRSDVRGRTLTLGVRTGLLPVTRPIRYTLVVRDIRGLELAGSGSIHAVGLDTDRLSIRLSGSGHVTVDSLRARLLEVDLSGSGRCRVAGEAESQQAAVSGSGSLAAEELRCREAEVRLDGSGDAAVWATDRLSVRIRGSGGVAYRGNPRLETRIDGSGRIRSLD